MEIAKSGTISKASENLFISQAHLSNILKDLENELGIEIFKRTKKGVILTDDGREFLNYAEPLVNQHQNIMKIYSNRHVEPKFKFSVSTQRYSFVKKAVIELYKVLSISDSKIYIREKDMYNVIGDVYNRKSDVGIIFFSSKTAAFIKRYLSSKNLEFNEITVEIPCAILRSGHPLSSLKEVSLEQLAAFPYATFESEASAIDFDEEVIINNLPNCHQFIVSDHYTMVNIITNTDAYTIGSGISTYGYTSSSVTKIPIKGFGKEITLGWIRLKGSTESDIILKFVEYIKNAI